MSGAFLGISVGRSRRIRRRARHALLDIQSTLGGPTRRLWGDVLPGSAALLTWERESSLGATVRHDADGASMVCGPSATLEERSDAATTSVGVYSTIAVDETGAITARSDDLGYGSVFQWSGDDIAAVSTRPELVATVAAAVGEPVTKDPPVAAELAHVGWLGPSRTGWREITALRAGETAHLQDGKARTEVDPLVARWAHEPPRSAPLADLIDQAAELLLSNVRRTLDTRYDLFADLTAGQDSRMVVAAINALDALDQVTLQTIGDPDLADVRGAAAVADQLGARHRHGFFYPIEDGSFGERRARHSWRSRSPRKPRFAKRSSSRSQAWTAPRGSGSIMVRTLKPSPSTTG